MRKIDLISQSPNNYIFQSDSNKTTFGGLLSLIYIIFALLIFLLYFTKYLMNESYEIVSFISEEKSLKTWKEVKIFEKSEKYNPILNISFQLYDYYYNNLSDRFIIYDYSRDLFIEREKFIKRRANDLHFYILYKCINQTDCYILPEDISPLYLLTIQYDDFSVDPQNDIPIKRIKNEYKVEPYVFNSDIELRALFRWNIIRYENTKGLFDIFDKKEENDIIREKDLYIGGYYQRYDTNIIIGESAYNPVENTKLMLMLDTIGLTISYNFLYEDYLRKKNSILDSFANIFSLWISSYNLLSFLFSKLYSKSFDKYKIIDNILSTQKRKIIKNKANMKQNEDIYIKGKILENESPIELKEHFIINANKSNQNNNIIKDSNDINSINKSKKERILPKRTFLDFIFNTIYIEKCCHSRKQQIIIDCNNIILKYYSIENILYYQFLFDNLIKDYKWNNPELENILNNNSFDYIKNNIKLI